MRISLFVPCYDNVFFPKTGKAVVQVLERLGHTVEFREEQACCGQMHYHAGYLRDAVPIMLHFLKVYQEVEAICVPSSSCVAMIRDHFPALAERTGDDSARMAVEELLPRVYEFSELLVDRLGVTEVGACFPHHVTLHRSCRDLRSLRLGDKPWRLLERVHAIELVDMEDQEECCGFGGTFAVNNPDVSAAMLSGKVQQVLKTRAEFCTGVDNSCLMHIGGALQRQCTGVRCLHLAEILASTGPGSAV